MQASGRLSTPLSKMILHQKDYENLTNMQKISSEEGLYINDFHRLNSMAALREVLQMSLRPYSREQKMAQIARLKMASQSSKESANAERSSLV